MAFETTFGPLEDVVRELRSAGSELSQVEVKAAAGGVPKSIYETISAFSNHGGGLIIFGLSEADGFQPAEGFDAKRIRDAMAEVLRPRRGNDASGPLTPRPRGTVEIALVDDTPVVVMEVEEQSADGKPTYVTAQGIENGTYERVGDGDHRMSAYQIYLLRSNHQQPTDDRQTVEEAQRSDLDERLIERFIVRLRTTRRRAIEDLKTTDEVLRRFRATDENGRPTLAGVLCFCSYPQQFFPQLNVSFASYPGASKDSLGSGTRMLDRRIIDGNIPVMVEDTINAILANLPSRRIVNGVGATDSPEIPVEVLREAITNALTHRDYSVLARGEQVRVELFPDRLEIWNPGGIWGGRRVSDLFDGGSRSRNQALANLLTMVPLPDRNEAVSENLGSGIPRMVGLLRAEGLRPKFEVRTTQLLLTLDRYGILDPETAKWLSAVGAEDLTLDQKRVLALVRHGVQLDDRAVGKHLGIDSRDASGVLSSLTAPGWLKYPNLPSGPYRLGPLLEGADDAHTWLFKPAELLDFKRTALDQKILEAFTPGEELDIHAISIAAGAQPGSVRKRLRVLVDQGALISTAPPTSKLRRYLLP